MTVNDMALPLPQTKRLLRASAACAIVSFVELARYPLIAGGYPKMATWDTMLLAQVIGRQGHAERAATADA
jgi:hypothetical protein